jgi:hypothetical protein
MFPKSRACRPERAFFSVATTLRWLDMRLPEEINPADGSELLQVFAALWPKFLPESRIADPCPQFRPARAGEMAPPQEGQVELSKGSDQGGLTGAN